MLANIGIELIPSSSINVEKSNNINRINKFILSLLSEMILNFLYTGIFNKFYLINWVKYTFVDFFVNTNKLIHS